jgi:hypothetical protein
MFETVIYFNMNRVYVYVGFQYEFPALKVHLDKSIVEVCSVGNAMHLHGVAVSHNLNAAADSIREFIGK